MPLGLTGWGKGNAWILVRTRLCLSVGPDEVPRISHGVWILAMKQRRWWRRQLCPKPPGDTRGKLLSVHLRPLQLYTQLMMHEELASFPSPFLLGLWKQTLRWLAEERGRMGQAQLPEEGF